MTIVEGVCGECYVCNPEIAEAKRKAESEAAADRTTAEVKGTTEKESNPGSSRKGEAEDEAVEKDIAQEIQRFKSLPSVGAKGGS